MAKVTFHLKNPHGKEPSPIKMYFRYGDETINISTGEVIEPNHWDKEEQKVLTKFSKKYPDLQNKLEEYKEVISGVYRRLEISGETITNEAIKNKFSEYYGQKLQVKHTIVTFAEWYIKQVTNIRKPMTVKGYRNTLKHLKDYQEHARTKLTFDKITVDFYLNFVDYLKAKAFMPNTIGNQIKNIKVFLNEATERGINKNMEYKSRRFKVMSEETDAIYLNEKELTKLYNLDLSKNTRLERVRDLFLVGCYTGLRFSDLKNLKKDHIRDGKINLRVEKTEKSIVIPVHTIVSQIMKKYKESTPNSLPPAISNQKMNGYLKEIGIKAKIKDPIIINEIKGNMNVETKKFKYELICTHTARRSFATNLYLSNFPTIEIRMITGHRTESSFLRYIKMEGQQSASRLLEHWAKQTKLKKVV